MDTMRTTESADEVQRELEDAARGSIALVALIEQGVGDDRLVQRWTVGPTFRPAAAARQIQTRVDRESPHGRTYVVTLSERDGDIVDRFFPDPTPARAVMVRAPVGPLEAVGPGEVQHPPAREILQPLVDSLRSVAQLTSIDQTLARQERYADRLERRFAEVEEQLRAELRAERAANDELRLKLAELASYDDEREERRAQRQKEQEERAAGNARKMARQEKTLQMMTVAMPTLLPAVAQISSSIANAFSKPSPSTAFHALYASLTPEQMSAIYGCLDEKQREMLRGLASGATAETPRASGPGAASPPVSVPPPPSSPLASSSPAPSGRDAGEVANARAVINSDEVIVVSFFADMRPEVRKALEAALKPEENEPYERFQRAWASMQTRWFERAQAASSPSASSSPTPASADDPLTRALANEGAAQAAWDAVINSDEIIVVSFFADMRPEVRKALEAALKPEKGEVEQYLRFLQAWANMHTRWFERAQAASERRAQSFTDEEAVKDTSKKNPP